MSQYKPQMFGAFARTMADGNVRVGVCFVCVCVYPRASSQSWHRMSWHKVFSVVIGKELFLNLIPSHIDKDLGVDEYRRNVPSPATEQFVEHW